MQRQSQQVSVFNKCHLLLPLFPRNGGASNTDSGGVLGLVLKLVGSPLRDWQDPLPRP